MQPQVLNAIRAALAQNSLIDFAYLYGTAKDSDVYHDIDIAVYVIDDSDPFSVSADLKIAFADKTGIAPDRFDVRVINHLLKQGDLFSLLYLKDVLAGGMVLADRDFDKRSDFIEAFGMKYRECEGLIDEVLA